MALPVAKPNTSVSTYTSHSLVHPSGHKIIMRGDYSVWDDTDQKFINSDLLVRK